MISKPTLIFAPGFGAGAVGGYVVMTIDPAIVAPEVVPADALVGAAGVAAGDRQPSPHSSMDDVEAAFGG